MTQRIANETVEQVKQFSGIVGYIQQFVSLKKRGQNYTGLCPFHSEKSPSFTVSEQKEIFHCFGCHESGDLISFAEKIEQLTFMEAVERIAVFAGISVLYEEQSPQAQRKQQLMELQLECLKQAQLFFVLGLKESAKARAYILSRKLEPKIVEQFELGYCSSSQALLNALRNKGISDDVLVSSGLFSRNERGLFCRFHQRLVFPIFDAQHRLLGFSGRVIESDTQAAKYINSDESNIFNKRKLLYGLHIAKKAIKEQGNAILVEGFMDVMMCVQFGFHHVVACMGTSLTTQQVTVLKRLSEKVTLVFDNDAAGQLATQRSVAVLMEQEMLVQSVRLKDKDPADFLLESGGQAFQEVLSKAVSAFEFLYEDAKLRYDSSKVEESAKCIKELLPVLAAIKDSMVQRHYVRLMASELRVEEELIMAKLNQDVYTESSIPTFTYNYSKLGKDKYQKAEETLIAIVSMDIDLRNKYKGDLISLFTNDQCKTMCEFVLQSDDVGPALVRSAPVELKKMLSEVLLCVPSHTTTILQEKMFIDCLETLQAFQLNKQMEELKKKIIALEDTGNDDEIERLMLELDKKKKGGIYGGKI